MTHKPLNLLPQLEPINAMLPLNYLKARPAFYSNYTKKATKPLKFIAIDKFKTERAIVNSPAKPISRCIQPTGKDEKELL